MKQSGYAKRLKKQRDEDSYTNYVMARQLMVDLLTIVLGQDFDFDADGNSGCGEP